MGHRIAGLPSLLLMSLVLTRILLARVAARKTHIPGSCSCMYIDGQLQCMALKLGMTVPSRLLPQVCTGGRRFGSTCPRKWWRPCMVMDSPASLPLTFPGGETYQGSRGSTAQRSLCMPLTSAASGIWSCEEQKMTWTKLFKTTCCRSLHLAGTPQCGENAAVTAKTATRENTEAERTQVQRHTVSCAVPAETRPSCNIKTVASQRNSTYKTYGSPWR